MNNKKKNSIDKAERNVLLKIRQQKTICCQKNYKKVK